MTHSGCVNRTLCPGSFDENSFFDDCVCQQTDTEVAGFAGIHVVGAVTILGVLLYALWASKLRTDFDIPWKAHAPLGIGLFYSGFSLGFTIMAGHGDDFFTAGAQNFIMFGLAVYTVMAGIILYGKLGFTKAAFYLVFAFCATAGCFTFCAGVVFLSVLGLVLFIIMSITVRCLRSSWYAEELQEPGDVGGPSANDHFSDAQGAAAAVAHQHSSVVVTVGVFVIRQLLGTFTRLINFVVQVGLLSFTVGDLQGMRQEVKEHFRWTFDFSMRVPELPSWCGWLVAQATEASTFLNVAAEEGGLFLLDYSNKWTPNLITAYSSVGVFEILVVAAVFIIVLSDCLLILAPREGSGEVAKHVVELAARVFLYVVQALVSVSHALILALAFIKPIERPPLSESQQFFADFAEPASFAVTNFYVGLVLLCAVYILLMLWSGQDGGLQNIAPRVLRMNGIDVREVQSGKACPLAFCMAFFGIWPQSVKAALEVEERGFNFRLGEEEVMLATVNALSFPIYIVPYGAVFAKLGEYMNQCPLYVAGRDFHCADVVLSLTYAAEYILVLCTCSELLDSAEQGYPTGEDAVANASDEWVSQIAVCWLCLTLLRTAATGIRDHVCCSSEPVDPVDPADPVKQGSGSLGVASCQPSKVGPEKQGTESLGVVSCQSSKAENPSQDVKDIEPTTSEV